QQRRDAERDARKAAKVGREKNAAAAETTRRQTGHPEGPEPVSLSTRVAGQMTVPVAGDVTRRWGEATDAGPAAGMSFRAPPGGRVVAPCNGRAAFAAPFRSYGKLLIIDC